VIRIPSNWGEIGGSRLVMFVQESFMLDVKVMQILLLATSFSVSLFCFNIVKH
jgi:hypothetical protein